jgi:hypothetical protein
VTSTAFIDVGAASSATGIAEAPAGNRSVLQAANAGAPAGFRSNWQAILNALAGAGQVNGTQAPPSQLREVLSQSNAKAIAQRASLSTNIRSEAELAVGAHAAGRPRVASDESRKGHAQKLAANTGSDAAAVAPVTLTPETPAISLIGIAATAAAPVAGVPLPASVKASPVVQSGLGFVESDAEPAHPSPVTEPTSASLAKVNANTFMGRVEQGREDTCEETVSGLDLRTDSSSTPDHFVAAAGRMPQPLGENATEKLTGKEQFATPKVDAAHARSAESRPAPAQSLAAHAASTIDDPPIRASEERAALQQSGNGIGDATSMPGSHAEFAGAKNIAAAAGTASTAPRTQPVSGTANPTPLDSESAGQQVRGEGWPQQATAAEARVASTSRVKQTATISGAQAGVASAAHTLPSSYLAHSQNPAAAADSLAAAALTKSESANELRVARDETQPQVAMGSAAHDPFAALDTHSTAPATTWLQAGTHHAEAGYLDPSLGWVGVRAQSSGSALHAAILPGSGEAAQALGGHLTELNSFMSEHHGRSSTVTLALPDQGQPQGGFNHSGGHSGEGPAQRQSHEGQAQGDAAPFPSQAATDTGTRTQVRLDSDAHVYPRDGVHISVIA